MCKIFLKNRSIRLILCFILLSLFASVVNAQNMRSLKLYNVHTKESLNIIYKRDGYFVAEALKKVNWFFRDWRRNFPTKIDPYLLDILWVIYKNSGEKKHPIFILSGFRSLKTNNYLRRHTKGVARDSQHTHGRAVDFYIPGQNLKKLRYIALRLQLGGVGYYPRANSPFIHVDTSLVRYWPKMSHRELLKVFPSGRTTLLPKDGKSLNGYRIAARRLKKLNRNKPKIKSIASLKYFTKRNNKKLFVSRSKNMTINSQLRLRKSKTKSYVIAKNYKLPIIKGKLRSQPSNRVIITPKLRYISKSVKSSPHFYNVALLPSLRKYHNGEKKSKPQNSYLLSSSVSKPFSLLLQHKNSLKNISAGSSSSINLSLRSLIKKKKLDQDSFNVAHIKKSFLKISNRSQLPSQILLDHHKQLVNFDKTVARNIKKVVNNDFISKQVIKKKQENLSSIEGLGLIDIVFSRYLDVKNDLIATNYLGNSQKLYYTDVFRFLQKIILSTKQSFKLATNSVSNDDVKSAIKNDISNGILQEDYLELNVPATVKENDNSIITHISKSFEFI